MAENSTENLTEDLAEVAELIRSGIEGMPYNQLVGVRITSMGGGRATGALAARPEIANHAGSVHASAQFALVEAVGGAAVSSAFVDLLGGAIPLAQGVELSYLRPATGDLAARAELTLEVAARVRDSLELDGHARFWVPVTITDPSGETTLEAQMRWLLRRSS